MDKLREARDTDDFTTPHKCDAGYVASNMGVDIEEEHKFQEELHEIVDKMKEDLVHEKKILEGTLEPEYNSNEYVQNELSKDLPTEGQWMTDSLSGSSMTDRIHTSIDESSTLFSTARPLSQRLATHAYEGKCVELSNPSCPVMWADCGVETEHSNEQSDCMEQTINVPMLGTLNEEK
jgi:hypothetical protein